MAVIFYDKGQHPAGFIGFRAVRTVGTAKDYRQRYFGLSEHSYSKARRLAHEQDAEWAAEAECVLKDTRFNKPSRASNEHIIATGLRASFITERKKRAGTVRSYIYPAFKVTFPGYGSSEKSFRIGKIGYHQAYASAVNLFCKIHDYDSSDERELLGRIPEPTVFLGELVETLKANGHEVDMYDLYDKLGVVLSGPDKRPVVPGRIEYGAV